MEYTYSYIQSYSTNHHQDCVCDCGCCCLRIYAAEDILVFSLDQETKNATKITMKLAYNDMLYLLASFFGISAIDACAR